MSLTARRISFEGYRNLSGRDVALSEGVTVLVGPNATGKTNTIEALQYLTAGTSFRRPTPAELVAEGSASGVARAELRGDGRVIDVEMRVTPERRTFLRNGKACRGSSLAGTLLSVLFCPDNLTLVKGSASARRGELDAFGGQANAAFRKVATTYARSVEQRNRLLKDERRDLALLDAWDESVALGAATLLYHRLSLFGRLAELTREVYGEVVPAESLGCAYVSSLGEGAELAGRTRDELAELMRRALAERRAEDLARRMTCVGPHRDDVRFTIDGRDARAYGSQGQQRTVALAWKMAEVRLCERLLGERPLLLLDDVMSELDERRRETVTRFVEGGIQTVITTTNLGYFSSELLGDMEVVRYGE